MRALPIFLTIYAAFIAMSFWEAYVEGRNPWNKRKLGWKIKFKKYTFPGYHFYLFVVMLPLLIIGLPLSIVGWNKELFGILLSAFASGIVLEDFMWFVVNPKVKLKEFWTDFSDYYPWIKINGKKILPAGYFIGIAVALLSWHYLWR